MGNGPFAVPAFDALADAGHDIAAVVVRPAVGGKSRGGPPPQPVRDWAVGRGLPIHDPASANDPAFVATLREFSADLLVVCDYGQILAPATLDATPRGGVNLHGSLLPRHRGAAPVQWAVLSGDDVAGVSVIHMTPRLDAGPVVTTASTPVGRETAGELENRLAVLGVQPTLAAVDAVMDAPAGDAVGDVQDASAVTKAPRLKKSDGAIDWGRSAAEIDAHVRGMRPWPVAFTLYRPRPDKPPIRLAVRSVALTDDPVDDQTAPGEIRGGNRFLVAAADRWVEITDVQPAGKKPMSGTDVLRGHPPPDGSRLYAD